MLNVQVINFRAIKTDKSKSLLGFFDIIVGDSTDNGNFAIKMNNCALKTKKDGGYWWQAPGQKRIDKQTGEVVKENGYDKYDNHYDITLTKTGDSWRPSTEGLAFKNEVTEQAVAAMNGGTKRGKPAPASVGAGNDNDDDFPGGEDDLPF